LGKIKQSNLLYGYASYTKIIPYYQKAGLYNDVEKYCLDELMPSIREAFKKVMVQRCTEIQEVYFYQYIARIYDKLRLTAKREKHHKDEGRFLRECSFYENKWQELKPRAEMLELEKEYKEMIEVFGTDTSSWPDTIKSRLESFINT